MPKATAPRGRGWSLFVASVATLGLGMFAPGSRAADPPAPVDFNRDIRPILSGHCFACHGPDEGKRQAGLRLDRREKATRPGRSGEAAIVPTNPDESALIERVFEDDADRIMPPPQAHKPLSPEQKATLRRWVAEGAEYREHWAFVKPSRPAIPAVADRRWVRNEIDAFVLARLEKLGRKPSAEADRTTLIRRLSLDLIGLPPTLAEIDAFLADASPDAYEKVVDRLLASPHYGERWARRWLDRARYADTNGYEKDRPRSIWPYRDWVISALNADMPFDRFTVEQVAGDLLPGATELQKVATGFHRNTMTNEEGGIDVEEFRIASVVDRVGTTGSVWLGLTLQCAQCHTHKFDPITQREYYRFFDFFNNADEPELDLPKDPIRAQREAVSAKIVELEAKRERQFPARGDDDRWKVLEPSQATSSAGATLTKQADGSILASGTLPEADTYTVVVETPLAEIEAIRLEALADPSLPATGPGRAPNGNFVLLDFQAVASPLVGEGKSAPIAFEKAEADASQGGFDVGGAIDSNPQTGWAVDAGPGRLNQPHTAKFRVKGKAGFVGGTRLTLTLDQKYGGKHMLGRFRVSARPPSPEPTAADRRRHLADRLAEWEAGLSRAKWTTLTPSRVASKKGATMTVLADRSTLATGDKPNNDTYELEVPTDLARITALRLEVLPDPSLPEGGPGRAPLHLVGGFLLTEMDVTASAGAELPRKVAFRDASHDRAEPGSSAALAVDGLSDTGWSMLASNGWPHAAVFPLREAVGGASRLNIVLHQDGIHQTTIGRFRLSATGDDGPVRASGVPAEVEEVLLIPRERRTEDQSRRVLHHFLSVAPELASLNAEIEDLRRSLPRYSNTLVMQERQPEHHRTTFIRKRGEFLQPTEPVGPGVPAALHPLPRDAKPDRLALARWLVAEDNPLVGRVAMNQAWQAFFGRGLVATVEDFGTRGDEPTHPELLDWLATEFPRRGWSMKAMHRQIVTSATYRQSSRVAPERLAADPLNRDLARGPRFRVDAEMVRDIALSASGLLHTQIGGPSVFPPQPDGANSLVYAQEGWATSVGPARYRRGLYTYLKRSSPYAAFATFDAPRSEATCVRRERSNTPLQALTLLNDTVFVEASRALARRVLAEGPGSFDGRARLAFRLCLARPPKDAEMRQMAGYYDIQLARFRAGQSDAPQVAGIADKSADAAELAAWTALSRVLLNLDETITKE